MEEKIQEEIEKRFNSRIKIDVKYKDFRIYEIIIKLEYKDVQYESKIEYIYEGTLTIEGNLNRIVDIIDRQIILPFYKKENRYE